MEIRAIDRVQLAMPAGGEGARAFHANVLVSRKFPSRGIWKRAAAAGWKMAPWKSISA